MATVNGGPGDTGPGNGPSSELAPYTGTDAGTVDSLGRWLIAWAVGILIIWLLNKSRWGHTIIYYTLVLMLVFLALTQYQWLAWALQPFSRIGNKTPSPDTTQAPTTGGARDLSSPPFVAYLTHIPRRTRTPITL